MHWEGDQEQVQLGHLSLPTKRRKQIKYKNYYNEALYITYDCEYIECIPEISNFILIKYVRH